MAAKTIKEALQGIKFKTKAEEVAFGFGWNAATLAAEEKFTSTNSKSAPLKIGKLMISQSLVAPDLVYIGEAEGGEGGDFHKSDFAPVVKKFYSDNF